MAKTNNMVPDGWAIRTLSDLASIDNKSLKNNTDPDYRFRYIDIASVKTAKVDIPTEYVSFGESPSRARKCVRKGDVLMSTVRPNLKGFAYFDVQGDDFVASTGFAVLTANKMSDSNFLYQSILSDNVTRQIEGLVAGSNYPAISSANVKNLEVLAPPLPEQQKIATILSSVDEVIEKTRAQIDKLKDLKTGMMQELLTKGVGVDGVPHTEFKDSPVGRIPVEWDVVHLESLVSIIESGWSPQCDSVPAKGCEWAVLKTTAVSWDGFDFTANKKLPDELEPRPKIQVEVHDILITRAGPAERVGVVSYVEHVPRRIMLSDKLIRIKAHHNQNPQFLSFWLSTEFVRNYFSQRTTGLAQSQTNISQDILKSLLCVVPPLAEQETISSTISALEKQLMTKRNILSHYEKMKKALMQDLLTGKVRVTPNESAAL